MSKVDLDEVSRQLESFAKNPLIERLDFQPTDQRTRHQIHERAQALGLAAVSEGVGEKRHAVIFKIPSLVEIEEKLRKFATDEKAGDRLDMPPAPENIRYSTRLAARKLGLSAISEGVANHRHTVVWKKLDETKIQSQLKQFLSSSENKLELPPANGYLRYFTATSANDFGLTSVSEGEGSNRHCVVYKHPPEQLQEVKRQSIKQLFDTLDGDRDNCLTLAEVRKAMETQKLPVIFADNLFHEVDKNRDGKVEFEEFFEFVASKDREIRAVFNALDSEHVGHIPADKLKTALKLMNFAPVGKDQGLLKALIAKTGSGNITYQQFRDFCALLSPIDFGRLHDEWIWAANEGMVSAVGGPHAAKHVEHDGHSLEAAKVAPQPVKAFLTQENLHALYSGFAGGLSNVISRTVVAPMERVRLQLSVDPAKYPTTISCFKDILQKEGVKGYWRGNWINVLRIAPQGAIAFLTKDFFNNLFGGKKATPAQLAMASCLAGMVCMTAVYPLDMIRGRVTTSPGIYKGLGDGLRTVYRKEGFRALFLGLWPANAWAIPYYGTQFFVYDSLKKVYAQFARDADGKPKSVGPQLGLVFGAVAGGACTAVAYPLELIRRRLQVQGFAGRPVLYKGMNDCFTKIVQSEGVKGLFRGLGANLLKSPLAVAVVYGCYEQIMKHSPFKPAHH